MENYTREQLIDLCAKGSVPEEKWSNRDSSTAQRQLGEALMLLKAGCEFKVTGEHHVIRVEITYNGFNAFEMGGKETDSFYIPTPIRLLETQGQDWY